MVFGIRKMLSLVLYAEKTIKDAVVSAYKRLYLTNNSNSLSTAKQLIKLVQDLTICERDALEELIGEFASSGELDNSIIQILWEIFADKDALHSQNRLNALILLGMIIKKVPEKGRANITVLVEYGLPISNGNQLASNSDMIRISETCHIFSLIGTDSNTRHLTQQDTNVEKKDKKSKKDQPTQQTQSGNLKFNNEPFKLANSHYNPILLVEKLTEKLIDQIPPFKNLTKVRNLFGDSNSEASEPDTTDHSVKTGVLSRFFSFIGFLATKLLIFLNQTFVCELKRRKMCKESQKQNQLDSTRPMSKTPSAASSKSKKRKSIRPLNSNDNALEEEMGLQGAEAEDAELMFVDSLIDQKLAQTQTHGPNSCSSCA